MAGINEAKSCFPEYQSQIKLIFLTMGCSKPIKRTVLLFYKSSTPPPTHTHTHTRTHIKNNMIFIVLLLRYYWYIKL